MIDWPNRTTRHRIATHPAAAPLSRVPGRERLQGRGSIHGRERWMSCKPESDIADDNPGRSPIGPRDRFLFRLPQGFLERLSSASPRPFRLRGRANSASAANSPPDPRTLVQLCLSPAKAPGRDHAAQVRVDASAAAHGQVTRARLPSP